LSGREALAEAVADAFVWACADALAWLVGELWAFVDIPSASATSARIP
jgi:hypothetical protein